MNEHAISLESDYQRRVSDILVGQFITDTDVEIIHPLEQRGGYRHALFDFDGTISLLRAGWPVVMMSLMQQVLLDTPNCEPEPLLVAHIYELIERTTGKQTIYQMIELCDEVVRRGGHPLEAVEYKRQYLDLLMQQIRHRLDGIRSGLIKPQTMMLAGSIELLEALQLRGVCMYLASGTDQEFVRDEANLLGVAHYFGDHIYGAIEDYKSYSKAQVIERILTESKASGSELLGFGDGFVEIDNTKNAGGVAIGVASDEEHRSGLPDPVKRDRLIGVGADIIVPDFKNNHALIDYLFGETK